jgi:acyl-coenzyme A synthetase/AMP-(fatty) acid ligase
MIDLADMIFFHADANPEKPAVITREVTLTYGMLRRGILSVERQLRLQGLKAGDQVGICIVNAIGHMTLICALHRAGIASVSLDPPQVEFLDDLVIDALLTNDAVLITTMRKILVDEAWFNGDPPEIAGPNLAQQSEGKNLCRLILSSGTTGRPKIIALSFAAVCERLVSYSIRTSTPSWDRVVCMVGLSTNYGYSFAVTTLWLGRTLCFPYEGDACKLTVANQGEMLVASTAQIALLVKEQEAEFVRLDSLRAVHIGGSVAYAPLIARIRILICNNLYCGYGSTEGGTVAYALAESIFGMDRAVGLVTPWVELEVTDEQNKALEYGKEGQLRIRALGQGFRYQKKSPTEYEIDDSEWFYPGDQGLVFRNGMLVITGRTNEIINRGGIKVAPDTIEEVLKQHPAVADIAAVGMLDKIGIEQIWVAVVQRGAGELDIGKMFEYCRKVAPLYVPDRIFQISEIPRNRLGKIARETLKEKLKTLEEDLVLTIR